MVTSLDRLQASFFKFAEILPKANRIWRITLLALLVLNEGSFFFEEYSNKSQGKGNITILLTWRKTKPFVKNSKIGD